MDRYQYVVTVEVAVARGERFLFTVRADDKSYAPGILAYPGGKVEPEVVGTDVLEEAARRELREETGLEVDDLEYLESKSFKMFDDTFALDVVFLAEAAEGEPEVADPNEVKDVLWLTLDEVLEHPLSPPWMAQSIRRAARRLEERRARDRRLPAPLPLDHVQLAMPRGEEGAARAFYGALLGLPEVPKPEPLRSRGGVWFDLGGSQLHLGVEEPFTPARKAHPCLVWPDLDTLATRLGEAGHEVAWDENLPGVRRFYAHDPFGNRLEFMARPVESD